MFTPTGKPSATEALLDFGLQPVCSHFLRSSGEQVERHPLVLAVCLETGLVHLRTPFPMEALVPRFDWIKYNEPEDHLDQMVKNIMRLPGITPQSSICGISYKDDSILARFERLGFDHAWRIDPRLDLGITDPNANIESVQHALTGDRAGEIAHLRGQADIVVVRHILEHAENPREFVSALKTLLAPGGYLVVEVPDCQKSLERSDYTMVWEEHTLYFTEHTLRSFSGAAGLDAHLLERYTYPFEDSLVAYFQPSAPLAPEVDVACEIERARGYAVNFPAYRNATQSFFEKHQTEKIALFGAGHLSCAFINLFNLSPYIQFVADDNPHKQGLRMPGSALPIRPSSALPQEHVQLCLLGVNPVLETLLLSKLGPQVATLRSLFPGSTNYYLRNHG